MWFHTDIVAGSFWTLGLDKYYKEWCEPYRPRDYEGLIEEFMAGVRKRQHRNGMIDSFIGAQERSAEPQSVVCESGPSPKPVFQGITLYFPEPLTTSKEPSGGIKEKGKAEAAAVVREVEVDAATG